MHRVYFVIYDRVGNLHGVHSVGAHKEYDSWIAGQHFALGFRKHLVTYPEAEQIAFDGLNKWKLDLETMNVTKR